MASQLFQHAAVVGVALAGSEAVATFGLLVVISASVRSGRTAAVPAAVGAWIAAAICFTPSGSFANPAVTVARALADTYTASPPPVSRSSSPASWSALRTRRQPWAGCSARIRPPPATWSSHTR